MHTQTCPCTKLACIPQPKFSCIGKGFYPSTSLEGFIYIAIYMHASLVPRPYELGSGDMQHDSVVQTAEIVGHRSNSKQVQTTKMHLSDSRQQNVIDVNTCNYAFKRLHFEPRNCIACHQTLVCRVWGRD